MELSTWRDLPMIQWETLALVASVVIMLFNLYIFHKSGKQSQAEFIIKFWNEFNTEYSPLFNEFIHHYEKDFRKTYNNEDEIDEKIAERVCSVLHDRIKYEEDNIKNAWLLEKYLFFLDTLCYHTNSGKMDINDVKHTFQFELTNAYKFFIYTIIRHRENKEEYLNGFENFTTFVEDNFPQVQYVKNKFEKKFEEVKKNKITF